MVDRPSKRGNIKGSVKSRRAWETKLERGTQWWGKKKHDREGEHMASASQSISSQATCQYIHTFSGFDLWICLFAGGHCLDRFLIGLIHHTLWHNAAAIVLVNKWAESQHNYSSPIGCLWPLVKTCSQKQLKHTVFWKDFFSMESLQWIF